MYLMKIDEALYQIKQRIKMHELEGTTNSVNEREKTILDYITNLQNEIFDLKDTIQNKNDCIGAYECIIEDRDKRIDKAIKKIEKDAELIDLEDGYNTCMAVIDILRGDE